MPAVQTAYAPFLSPGTLGMMANGEWVTNVISRVVDPAATVAVSPGDPVLQGSSEQLVVSGDGGSGAFRGVAVRDPTLPPTAGDAFAPGVTLGVMTQGVIWVNAAAPVSPGQPAFFTPGGALTSASSGNAAIPNAIWESAAATPGLAKLRLG